MNWKSYLIFRAVKSDEKYFSLINFFRKFVGCEKVMGRDLSHIPKLILGWFPVLLKIISDQVIFPFFQVMRKQRFFLNKIRKHEILSIKEFHRMSPQSFRTII